MTVSTSVKWAVSSMTGAPTLNGIAGSMIAVLDAFLVNGFGAKAVDSATVTDGICRMGITGGSAAQDHCVIQLAGLTGSGVVLNGLQRVTAATASYVEFACDLPDGPLTGTITFKIAPLGWEKVFSKTNVAVYRSTDASGTRAYHRVDDSNALYARVQMYESMTDVDTGVAVAPTSPAGGFYWHKRSAAASTGVYWVLSGDSRSLRIGVAPNAAATTSSANGYGLVTNEMGDMRSYRSGDAWCATLTGSVTATYSDTVGDIFSGNAVTGMCVQRMSTGIGGAYLTGRTVNGTSSAASGADSALGAFPSRADNGLRISPIMLADGAMATFGPRGELRGAFHISQNAVLAAMGADARLLDGQGAFSGRKLLIYGCGTVSAAATGCSCIDVTGPWE